MNNYVLGLELLIIGMGTVFLSLYLLSIFLHFSGKLFGPESKDKRQYRKQVEMKSKILKSETEAKESEIKTAEEAISPQKIAAVTAAVYENFNEQKNYRIISIIKNNKNWKNRS